MVINMKQNREKGSVLKVIWYLLLFIIVVAAGVVAIKYAPHLKLFLTSEETIVKLEKMIDSFGAWGIVILLLLQIVQVFVALIPSEPIEIAAGMCYGGWWGFVLCAAGVILGSFGVFSLIKRFGTPFVHKLVSEKKLKEFHFLKNAERMEMITFILYFIPGLPKDVFTYFAALTPLSTKNFLIISIIARTPSILISNIAGAQYMEGNYEVTIVLFAVFAALGLLGMVCYKLISKRLNNHGKENQKKTER
ncbi:MAG: TVP38/TMEM64 family protein [Clostridiales bacterium]|nr:TVP38/TMEM64 family protein [Clostridiales bacterium]